MTRGYRLFKRGHEISFVAMKLFPWSLMPHRALLHPRPIR
jgi:hypothetical protein